MRNVLPWITWSNTPLVKEFLKKRHHLEQDPFLSEPGYPQVREAFRAAIGGDLKQLTALLAKIGADAVITKTIIPMAIFMEVSMLYTLDSAAPKEAATINQTLLASQKFTDPELQFCRYLIFNNFPHNPEIFTISKESKLPQILFLSSIVRVVAMGFSTQHSLLHTLLFSPMSLGTISLFSL